MYCNQIFSLINNNKIENIIVCANYETANQIARNVYGDTAIAIDTTLYPVGIGNTYRDGLFYDFNNNVIERNLTEKEQIEKLKSDNDALLECLLEITELIYS